MFKTHPTRLHLALCASQGLICELKQGLRSITRAIGRHTDTSHWRDVSSPRIRQALQGNFQSLCQLDRLLVNQAGCQHRELTTTAASDQIVGFRIVGAGALQLLTNSLQQLVGALTAQTLVEARQVLYPQQQQVTRSSFL
ncbi:hypothetical protein D3C77_415110 [compost metagenome]